MRDRVCSIARLQALLGSYFCADPKWTWNQQHVEYDRGYIDKFYRHVEEGTGRRYRLGDLTGPGGAAKGNPEYEVMGVRRYWRYSRDRMQQLIDQGRVVQTAPGRVPAYKRYLDEMPGKPLQDLWTDIPPIGPQARERLGYPTQKPRALIERIIAASSNEGDLILDPFCGCGTTIAAADRLKRRWVGIDITHLAISLIRHRLRHSHGDQIEETYDVVGEPESVPDAESLAAADPFQFQFWALGLVGARPAEPKKGADKGVDGRRYFHEVEGGNTQQIVFSVKAGTTGPDHVRELRGVVEREGAAIGALLCLRHPTKAMRSEAASAGVYASPWGRHPRVQVRTIQELLSGIQLDAPPTRQVDRTFRKPPKVAAPALETPRLDFQEPPAPAARLPERAKPVKAGLARQRRTKKQAS